MWTKDDTGSVVDKNEKVIWFSEKRFVRDIALGNCCFICGASPDTTVFNDEHILPEWLLRRFNLFSRGITLPNGNSVRYDRYTVPCCLSCNSLMGTKIETPISKLTAYGRQAVRLALHANRLPFFGWLGLIYLKTHLKDGSLRQHLDERKGRQKIGDGYEWSNLHHLHSIVRSFVADVAISQEALGSFMLLKMELRPREEPFDFGDLYLAQTMLLRINDMAFITAFGDAGCTLHYFKDKLVRMGPLNGLQLREVMAEVAAIRLHMKMQPTFRSLFDLDAEKHLIYGDPPDYALMKWRPQVKGKLLYHAMQPLGPGVTFAGHTREEAVRLIKSGKMTFLFDDEGDFIPADERQEADRSNAQRERKVRRVGGHGSLKRSKAKPSATKRSPRTKASPKRRSK
jgi:hypothetical protein